MHLTRALALLALPLALAACSGPTQKQDTGLVVGAAAGGLLGNTVGKGTGKVAATIAGAMIGGIVGSEIGRSLDQQDRMAAQQAELTALEKGQSGVATPWRNPDSGRHGMVVPGRPYRIGANDCRDYTHTIYIEGQPQTMRGTACRNPDGTWRNVSS
jgi:surface antigen